jgi:hypothetical protein
LTFTFGAFSKSSEPAITTLSPCLHAFAISTLSRSCRRGGSPSSPQAVLHHVRVLAAVASHEGAAREDQHVLALVDQQPRRARAGFA